MRVKRIRSGSVLWEFGWLVTGWWGAGGFRNFELELKMENFGF